MSDCAVFYKTYAHGNIFFILAHVDDLIFISSEINQLKYEISMFLHRIEELKNHWNGILEYKSVSSKRHYTYVSRLISSRSENVWSKGMSNLYKSDDI